MSLFSEGQSRVLRSLLEVWPEDRFVVVGATALGVHLDMRWRQTMDLDLTVAASVEEYVEALEARGWSRLRNSYQEWTAAGGHRVDIIPATPEMIERGTFVWPDGATAISLVGFRMAFATAMAVPLDERRLVRIASLPALTLMKMVAFLERPYQRDRDLSDIAYILEEHLAEDAAERWSDEVVELNLDFEDVGAFILGRRVAKTADAAESREAVRFVDRVLEPGSGYHLAGRISTLGPQSWRDDPDTVIRRFEVLKRGLSSR